MRRTFQQFLDDDAGATAIEYALVAALFAIASIVAARAFGTNATAMYDQISEAISGAVEGGSGGGGDGGGGGGGTP